MPISNENSFSQTAFSKDLGFWLEDKINELGGKFERATNPLDPCVVVDGQLYTGQNPRSAKPLAESIVQDLRK